MIGMGLNLSLLFDVLVKYFLIKSIWLCWPSVQKQEEKSRKTLISKAQELRKSPGRIGLKSLS